MSKKSIQRKFLAAAFLASAAKKILPEIQFVESGLDQLGFYYDFCLPYPISKSHLEELERKANKTSSDSKISFKEMMVDNAKNYLEHLGQIKRIIDGDNLLVNLIEIDGFTDYFPVSVDLEDNYKFFIKLSDVEKINENTYRVSGFVFEDSKECSKFLKKLKDYENNNFLTIGSKRKWFGFQNDQLYFYPNGVILKNKILKLLTDEIVANGYRPFQSYPTSHFKLIRELTPSLNKVFEVIFDKNPNIEEDDPFNSQANILIKQTTFIFNNEFLDECISYLQSIVKMLNILGFRFGFELCASANPKFKDRQDALKKALHELNIEYELQDMKVGCELKVFALDKIGRNWNVSTLKLSKNTVESDFCSSLNRWIALVTESDKPAFEILPEHIRLILLDRKYIDYANEVCKAIRENGFCVDIDDSENPLNERVFAAKLQEVPYIGVIGEKEAITKTIALRSESGHKMLRLKLYELLEKLNRKENIENQ